MAYPGDTVLVRVLGPSLTNLRSRLKVVSQLRTALVRRPFTDDTETPVNVLTGATPHNAMTHIAMLKEQDGEVVIWLEHVTGKEYNRADN
jgi:hypothetical protein